MTNARWHLRFENFKAALARLSEPLGRFKGLSELEKAGTIQLFEIAWEMGWKSMRDYLAATGTAVKVPSAANVIRASFEINLIKDGDSWIKAMNARNVMAHEYDPNAFEETVNDIEQLYFPLLVALDERLEVERAAGN